MGLTPNLMVQGDLKQGSTPQMTLSSTINLADLGKLGFDASQFGTGSVAFVAKPADDGSLGISLDLKNAAVNIKDLGISKDAGVPGMLTASIKQKADTVDISDIDLRFGDVKLKGGLEFDSKKGLQSAEFSNFALSPGDAAQISLTPINGGYQVRIRGDQLDLKPLLKRFFSLDQGSGGPQATSFTQTIAVDARAEAGARLLQDHRLQSRARPGAQGHRPQEGQPPGAARRQRARSRLRPIRRRTGARCRWRSTIWARCCGSSASTRRSRAARAAS